MTLTVTPGGENDDSYLSLVDLKAKWDLQGRDYSSYSDAQIEVAARAGTAWIDGRYRESFPGARTAGRGQSLEWPRSGAYDIEGLLIPDDEIPREIEAATAEAAWLSLNGTVLSPNVTPGSIVKRTKVGPLEKEYFASGGVDGQRVTVTAVDDILSGLFTVDRSTKFLLRV